jgi:hypothetical protein
MNSNKDPANLNHSDNTMVSGRTHSSTDMGCTSPMGVAKAYTRVSLARGGCMDWVSKCSRMDHGTEGFTLMACRMERGTSLIAPPHSSHSHTTAEEHARVSLDTEMRALLRQAKWSLRTCK